jgi:putative hydrolase of the HAD superfamily
MLELIAFDADDTLWHTESLYSNAQTRFVQLLAEYHPREWIERRLYATEMANLRYYGYGIKSFILSMIESSIELTEGRITGREIQQVIDLAKEMLSADVRPLEQVESTVTRLAEHYPLMIITKGDLFDQESKVARSGLGGHFKHVEIVSDKTPQSYAALLARYNVKPENFLMVGNSLRSDILPVAAIGGRAVYVPYTVTWAHEAVDTETAGAASFVQLEHIGQLVDVVEKMTDDSR